jgi:DNA-binding FadR family transcriptional regulator
MTGFDSTVKRAFQIANLIQEDVVCGTSAPGDVVGSEQQLCVYYNVGRGTLREAIRILEFRGVGRMRRGPNGGLIVELPGVQLVGQSFCGHALLLGVTSEQLRQARRAVSRIAMATTSIVVDLFNECLSMLDLHVSADGELTSLPISAIERITAGERRAGQIARKIMTDLMRGPVLANTRLGTEADLCRRFSISKSVARQTARLLEDAGIVQCRRGRGQGLFVNPPNTRGMLRTICLYLQTHSVTASMSWEIGQLLSVECAGLAAEHADHVRALCAGSLASLVENVRSPTLLQLNDMVVLDRSVEDSAGNSILSLMLESLKAYSALTIDGRDITLSRFAGECSIGYLDHTHAVVRAISKGDPQAAVRAQTIKNHFFENRVRDALISTPPD